MHINQLTPAYQPFNIANELVDIDVIESELNTDFEQNASQQEGIVHQVYDRPGKEYLQKSPVLETHVDSER